MYYIIKYVEAETVAQAMEKSKKVPVHEIYIHNSSWEKDNYALTKDKASGKKIGFDHVKKGRISGKNT